MNYITTNNFAKKILAGFLFTALLFISYLTFFGPDSVVAQSGGSGSSYMATLIGGETEGVSDVCCNGIILSFSSINSNNQNILDGDAMFVPKSSESYDNGNEFSEGYNTLGLLSQSICLDIAQECESGDIMPQIKVIGTAPSQNSGGGGGGGGGGGF